MTAAITKDVTLTTTMKALEYVGHDRNRSLTLRAGITVTVTYNVNASMCGVVTAKGRKLHAVPGNVKSATGLDVVAATRGMCTWCNGQGKHERKFVDDIPCNHCDGTGKR